MFNNKTNNKMKTLRTPKPKCYTASYIKMSAKISSYQYSLIRHTKEASLFTWNAEEQLYFNLKKI